MGSKANIAVITAPNPQNSGMYSVDLAAQKIFTELGVTFTLFLPQAGKKKLSKYVPLRQPYKLRFGRLQHQLLRSIRELSDFTHIVYWGDYLNNPRFGHVDFSPRDIAYGHSNSPDEAYRRWSEIFALSNEKPSARIIAVGGNFQHSFNISEAKMLQSFLGKADLVLPRDPYSVSNLRPLTPSSSNLKQGMDCAFLLDPNALDAPHGKHFCYEFGRSALPDLDQLIRSVETVTGLKAVRLPKWLHLTHKNAERDFQRQRDLLSSAQFVVTDIYHLSINTLNCGVPVYCLGRPAHAQTGTLGDFKKKELFSMLGLADHYFELADDYRTTYEAVRYSIKHGAGKDSAVWQSNVDHINEMKESFRRTLVAAI